ncbi:MAG: hypothetical protein K2X09_05130 [Rickettsiales bacterium]|nr:hypothetical protein [Rickettsiales bacterium]
MKKYKTIEYRIYARISRKKCAVVLREDFEDLGDYDQVGRALRQLAAKGKIMKIGYGLYAKTRVSPFSGRTTLKGNLPEIATEALQRLGVETAPSTLEKEYNAGRTTQVPTGRLIGITSRVRRKIGYNGTYVSYERVAG